MISFAGRVSDGELLISGAFDGSHVGKIIVKLVYCRGVTNDLTLQWPGDFIKRSDSAVMDVRIGRQVYEKDVALVSVHISSADLPTRYTKRWLLVRLFPESAEEFEQHYFRKKHRQQDFYTHLFSVNQIMRYYDIDLGHRCVAAVILAYRNLDIGKTADFDTAIDYLRALILRVAELPQTNGPRTDRDHLTGSLYTALWLMLLGAGRFDEILGELDSYVALLRGFDDSFAGVVLNGSLSILLCAYLHQLRDEAELADELYAFNHQFYVHHLPRLTPSPIWFNEMLQAHKAVAIGLTARRAGAVKATEFAQTVLELSHRVFSTVGRELLSRRFTTLVAQVRAAGGAHELQTR
ncbi:MAG: hypothetical protein JWR75_356 [Devosia sp.]|nr:hypothetical protein [Devosia sp.]